MDLGIVKRRRAWLLLFLSEAALGKPKALDPIRIQKGIFLLTKKGLAGEIYGFRPYNWGPFSSDIYNDLDQLEADGLVTREAVPGQTWHTYATSTTGDLEAAAFAATVSPEHLAWLKNDRAYVASKPFADLLRDIYARYPEYAVQSRLNR